jgi:hypothetical protein
MEVEVKLVKGKGICVTSLNCNAQLRFGNVTSKSLHGKREADLWKLLLIIYHEFRNINK